MSRPTIGILAGMGPSSTAPFLDLVYAQCRSQYGAHDDLDFPKMMICSQPVPFFHDREIDHAAIEAATIEGLRDLERSGADVIAIACNSVHLYFPRLAASISTPLLNIVEAAFEALPQDVRTVAVAASRPLAESGLYQRAAKQRGLDLAEPEPAWQPVIDELQDLVKTDPAPERFGALWERLFSTLEGSPVDAVVIACLDLSGVVRYAAPPVPTIDAAEALAARLIGDWLHRCRSAGHLPAATGTVVSPRRAIPADRPREP